MATLMMHRDVLKGFGRLPAKVQKRIAEFVERFQEDPSDPGLHVHPLKESMLDPKVHGANLPGAFRAIIIAPEKGDTWVMMHVDKHDDAYAWAKNKRFEVHAITGVFQTFDLAEVEQAVMPSVESQAAEYQQSFLASLSDEDLYLAGIPEPLVRAVRDLKTEAELDALAPYLPPDSRDVLYGLVAGLSLDESLKEMLGLDKPDTTKEVAEPGDFTNIASAVNFNLVTVEGEDELKRMLAGDFEEWRLFLHPYQKKVVEWNTKGPMKITGAAGTGKTIALLHRAVRLAKHGSGGRKILLTTFTTNLSVTLASQIRSLSLEASERIEVTNLHALARTICSRSGWNGRIANESEIDDVWHDLWQHPDFDALPLSQAEMRLEYDQVIDPNGIEDEDVYLTTVRSGRPRISRRQRRQAWPVFLAFQRELKRRKLLTFEGAVHQARLAAENGRGPAYDHVLVDEAQDFSLEALRLIRALSPIEEETLDPLCLAGDAHQRIYRRRIPMGRAGIRVVGRSRRLKINYRTTQEIRAYAQAMLSGLEIDDLDEGMVDTLADHSLVNGPVPEVVDCPSEEDEAVAIVDWVKRLMDAEVATHEICITPRKSDIVGALNSAGIPTFVLRPREMDPGSEESGVRLGSMKRIKGLEFRAVAMACSHSNDPMNDLENADSLQRCERYVAVTRAREQVLITIARRAVE